MQHRRSSFGDDDRVAQPFGFAFQAVDIAASAAGAMQPDGIVCSGAGLAVAQAVRQEKQAAVGRESPRRRAAKTRCSRPPSRSRDTAAAGRASPSSILAGLLQRLRATAISRGPSRRQLETAAERIAWRSAASSGTCLISSVGVVGGMSATSVRYPAATDRIFRIRKISVSHEFTYAHVKPP